MPKYDELKGYLADALTKVVDIDVFLQATGVQMDKIDKDTFRMRNNNFIFLADEKTVARLERLMYIPYDPTRTLTDRRALVASFFTGSGKIGATEIKEVVGAFTPSPTEVSFTNSAVHLKITRDIADSFLLSDCYFILRKKLPAHLDLTITVISAFQSNLYLGLGFSNYKQEVISICQPN